MSNILNPKEEVLSVQLTKHGRKLFSTGYFKPHFFSFMDETIIYDSSYTNNLLENNNEIHDRILYKSIMHSPLNLINPKNEFTLGNSSVNSDFAPSWSLKTLRGKINYNPEKSNYQKKCFTFEKIDTIISSKEEKISTDSITIENNFILLDLEEINVEDDIKNFEIELIYIDPLKSGSNGQIEEKLLFTTKKTNIIDDIIYDDDELSSKYFDIEINKNHAFYYFDILVDDEIDTEYIIASSKGIYETITNLKSGIPALLISGETIPSDVNPIPPGTTGDIITVLPDRTVSRVNPAVPSGRPLVRPGDDPSICRLLCCP